MSQTSNVDQEKAKKVVSILLWAPTSIDGLYCDAGNGKQLQRGAITGSKINNQLSPGTAVASLNLMGELAAKTRPGSTGTVHMMGGGGRLEQIRGSREVLCHEVAEHAAMLVGQSLANK
jgi:hypothetical protein